MHPEGGCGLSRHGTCERYTPYGPALIVRYYCREGRTTVSLLPDGIAARLTGTLADLAREVRTAELEGVEEAAQSGSPNPHIDRATRIARVKRRQELLYRSLGAIRGFLPDRFAGCLLQLVPMEVAVGGPFVLLLLLRCWCADSLSVLPPPIGFRPPEVRSPDPDGGHQQLKPRDSPALLQRDNQDETQRQSGKDEDWCPQA